MEPEKPKDLLDWLGISDAPNWRVARPLGGFLAVVITLLFILALIAAFAVIFHTIRTATSGAEEGINLGAGALVAAMLGAPFVIWGTFLKYQTVRYQKEGHITDRINKAVEQLGSEKTIKYHYKGKSGNPRYNKKLNEKTGKMEKDYNNPVFVEETVPNIEVRIGAILSLERIAQDSTRYDNGRDHVRVMEILCAYVRGNAPVNSTKPEEHETEQRKPRIDIQTLFDVLKRRSDEQIAIEAQQKYRLNFDGADLRGVNLASGKFAGAIFFRCNMQYGDLHNADLSGARLQGCSLNFVYWLGTNLTGARLDKSMITKPEYDPAYTLTGLTMARSLAGASFVGANVAAVDWMCLDEDHTFGTASTNVHADFDHAKSLAIRRNRSTSPYSDDTSSNGIENDEEELPTFKYWSWLEETDRAIGRDYRDFLKHCNLSGWPFED